MVAEGCGVEEAERYAGHSHPNHGHSSVDDEWQTDGASKERGHDDARLHGAFGDPSFGAGPLGA